MCGAQRKGCEPVISRWQVAEVQIGVLGHVKMISSRDHEMVTDGEVSQL